MKKRFVFFYVPFVLFIMSCSSTSDIYEKAYPTLSDGKYDSEFPYKSSSKQLEEISKSIKMINVLCFYTSYFFDEGSKITIENLADKNIFDTAYEKTNYHHPASGTATLIQASSNKVILLTCAHIVDFPDTTITYFLNEAGNKTQFIESVSIKAEQSNFVPDLPEGGKVEVISLDKKNDLALVGKRFLENHVYNFPVLKYPKGKAKELEWGSFVYAFGYPLGQKMISKGIVSSPDLDGSGTFLIDAVINRGFSGGAVFAIRDGVPNFEFVGLLRSVPSETEFILRPVLKEGIDKFNPSLPYKDDIYVTEQRTMRYGITRVIPIEVIEEFLDESKKKDWQNSIYNN